MYFASTSRHELQVVDSVLLIPTSFPTLVPFDQSGHTCHNLKIKLISVYMHREYTLLYTPHTSQFVSVPWKHWKSLSIRMLSTSANSSLSSAGGEKWEDQFVKKTWIFCFSFSYQTNTKMRLKFFITNCVNTACTAYHLNTYTYANYKPLRDYWPVWWIHLSPKFFTNMVQILHLEKEAMSPAELPENFMARKIKLSLMLKYPTQVTLPK